MGFTRAELDAFRGVTLPDLIGPGIRLLIVGINPGLASAARQAHFSRRGRFYRLNAHSSLADLSEAYREVAVAAGIPVYEPG